MSAPTTASQADASALADPADVLRARIAKRIRWAQHCRRPEAAEQVADEIVRDLVRSFGGAR